MEYYLDVEYRKNDQLRDNVWLNRVYTKLHHRLCDLEAVDIGVSFPRYVLKLGNLMRLHSSEKRLEQFLMVKWLDGLAEFTRCSDTLCVPNDTKYRNLSRVQTNLTPAKLRRLIKRGSIPGSDLKAYKAKMFSEGLSNPYVELESKSTGQLYRRYIDLGDITDQPTKGEFDYFGLSKAGTVPWF